MQKTYKVNCAWSIVVIIMIMFIIGNKDKIRWNIDNAWIMALVFLIGVEIVNDIYKKLHDLDYFLLRYGPKDVAKYVEDDSTVSKYYGTLPFY